MEHEFKRICNRNCRTVTGENGKQVTITVEEVLKNNDIRLTGVAIKKTSENMAPIVYLEEFFQQ